MGKYSKLIGTVIGGAIGFAAALGFLPEDFPAKEEVISAITLLVGAIGTFFAPKNAEG